MRRRRGGMGRYQAVVGPQVELQKRVFPDECAPRLLAGRCGTLAWPAARIVQRFAAAALLPNTGHALEVSAFQVLPAICAG